MSPQPAPARVAAFRAFEERFRKPRGYPAPPPPVPVSDEAVDAVERDLRCRLPDSYRHFVTAVGPCQVRGLGDAWIGTDGVPVPFETLWHPADIVKQCGEEWLAPIPAELAGGEAVDSDVAWKYLLPFASDGLGNWHCFRRQSAPADDLPVYYFDHDGGDIEPIANGLDDLIRQYLRVLPEP